MFGISPQSYPATKIETPVVSLHGITGLYEAMRAMSLCQKYGAIAFLYPPPPARPPPFLLMVYHEETRA